MICRRLWYPYAAGQRVSDSGVILARHIEVTGVSWGSVTEYTLTSGGITERIEMEKVKSILTGSVACPYCGERIVVGFDNKTKEIIKANHCAHSSVAESDHDINLTFTLSITFPVEVS